MKSRKSQITMFIMAGILILLLIGLALSLMHKGRKSPVTQLPEIEIDRNVIDFYVEDCIEMVTANAVYDVGFADIQDFNSYVSENVFTCTGGFEEIMESQGVHEVVTGEISADSIKNDDFLDINLHYPLEFKKGDGYLKLENFNHEYSLKRTLSLSGSNNRLVSPDGRYEITVPQGVVAVDENGNAIDEIQLEIVDIQGNTENTNKPIGNIGYKMTPAGAKFSPALSIKYKYEDSEIIGQDESEFKFSYYLGQPLGDTWVSYEMSNVDTVNNIIYARVDHFTEQAATSTGGRERCVPSVDGETGRFKSNGNGGRDHYTFSKAGYQYCPSGTCKVETTCGKTWTFPKPSGGTSCPTNPGSSGRYQSGEFLWKGRSESTCKLVILIPSSLSGGGHGGSGGTDPNWNDTSPGSCPGQSMLITEDSWCKTDCNTGGQCPAGMVNCDCHGDCRTAGDGWDACEALAGSGGNGSSSSQFNYKGTGATLQCGGGFLWKPVSETNHKLVVLLPKKYHDSCEMKIKDASGHTENGAKRNGRANGDRLHYRFSKPGSGYSSPAEVIVTCEGGESDVFNIPNTGSRCE